MFEEVWYKFNVFIYLDCANWFVKGLCLECANWFVKDLIDKYVIVKVFMMLLCVFLWCYYVFNAIRCVWKCWICLKKCLIKTCYWFNVLICLESVKRFVKYLINK